jgi:hypothetical protein
MMQGKGYTVEAIQQVIKASDAIVFHTAILPYMAAFQLKQADLKNKRCLLYFHGTDCRHYGKTIITQAKEALGNFEICVSTPDLLEFIPEAVWMPVARSFKDIKAKYTLPKIDVDALKALNANRVKTTLGHAPTNTERKGSALFYKIITELIQNDPKLEYQVIQNMSWDSCLSAMSTMDVYFDQHIIGAYGLASVEASIFKAAVFCKLSTNVLDIIKSETKLDNPFLQWDTEDELRERAYAVTYDKKIRRKFGDIAHAYCQAVHDEAPVAARFIKTVEAL